MSTYTFNEHNVCLNPTVVLLHQDKQYTGQVTVFKAPNGKWGYAMKIYIKFGNMGCKSTPPSICSATYSTMSEARKEGVLYYGTELLLMLQEAKEWNMRVAAGDSMGDGDGQLSLF